METTIEQQVAMDDALVPSAQRLRIERSNFQLLSDIQSEESTLQLVYDATANVHQHSIRFKMDHKKHILDLESFRNILHIYPRVQGQPFAELPFEEEILDFIRFLGHNATIRTLTDTSGYDSLRLSEAQILWGLYYKRNVDYAFLIGEDFVFQVEHKNQKKSNEMYYPRFTKTQEHATVWCSAAHRAYKEYYAIATGEAAPKPKASARRTRSGSDTSITPPTAIATPRPTAAATPRLTAAAKGKQIAKVPQAKSLSAPSEPGGYGIDEGTSSKPGVPDVPEGDERDDDGEGEEDNDDDENKDGGSDEHESDEETREGESFDPIPQTPEDSEDESDGEEDLGLNISEEERHDEEEDEDELYRDVNINQGRGLQGTLEVIDTHVTLTPVKPDGQQESSSVSSQFVTSMLNPTIDVGIESIFEKTSQIDVQNPTSTAPLPITIPTMTSSTIATTTTTSQAPIPPTLILSEVLQNLPTFALVFCFDDRLRSLEQNFPERMNEAVQVAVQLPSDWLREEAQKENDEFLRTVDENIKKIIKEQVKEQVKAQVSKILPRIEQVVNEQLEAKVLTRSSHSSRTSYAVAADLSEMELKKILIEKMEGNKSIQCSDAQRNLYKALVDAYEFDKIILNTYGETVTLKRRPDDDEDKDEEPSAGPDRGSKRRREEFETCEDDQPIVQSSQHPEWFSQPKKPPSPDRNWNKTLPAVHGSIQPWISELAKQAYTRSYFNELMDTPLDFSNFIMHRLRVDTLTPEILAGPTYDLVKGSCKSLIELEYHLEEPLPLIPENRGRHVILFAHFINNDLEYLRGGASSRKYTTSVTKTKAVDYGHIKWIKDLVPKTMRIQEPIDYDKHALWGVSHWGRKRQQFYGFAVNRESARDVYSKRRIIAVMELKIVEWHSYKHLDWIIVRCTYQPPDMVEREDIDYFNHENVGADADFNNSETSITDTQEKGIDYEEVFAPVARIKAIRLFLAYASFMGFMVYQMDVKSAFLYGTIEEDVAWYETLATYLLENGFHRGQIDQILFIKKQKDKPLLKDPDSEDVDVHIYRSMIGSLMYLTSSRPDIMFAPTTKLTFYKAFFSSQWKFLIHTILQSMSAKRTSWNEFSSAMASAMICLSTGRKFNFSKYIFESLVRNVDSSTKFYMYPRVGKGCSGVETPLFEGMLVAREPEEQGDVEEQGNEKEQGTADTTAEEPETTVPEDAADDQLIPSPTPVTPPPQQPQDEALDACAALDRRVEHLEQYKVAQDIEIIKLKTRVKKLEKTTKAKSLKLRRLRKVGTSQRVDTSDDTLMEDVYNQGREIDKDKDAMKETKEIREYTADTQVKGRQADIYHIDMDHAAKVLSMQEDESDVQEAVEVVTTAKLITEVVAAVSETVSAAAVIPSAVLETISDAAIPTVTDPLIKVAAPSKAALPSTRRKRGVVTRDPEEESSAKTPTETTSKDKGKAKGRKLIEEAKEAESIKQHLQIVPDEDDDVFIEATSLTRKVPVVDYHVILVNNKPRYKIIKADDTHQLYASFITMLKIFDREELETLWRIVKERFSTSKPNNFSDKYLLTSLKTMFERPDGQDNVWRNQCNVHGQALVKSWKLLTSCGVHIISFNTTQIILLVERRYPLTKFTLEQMLNVVRLQVEEASEMSLELIRFTRQ
uniref:Reverse transcriptase Ty1/copia-type domain-containing protein n=1 Tax=Tanacetum cinerariifolium TaxID=118510 RepID=A0A6L2NUR4_TANCI|nr:hypothetical protein [Tanacetum cinerariifolium]